MYLSTCNGDYTVDWRRSASLTRFDLCVCHVLVLDALCFVNFNLRDYTPKCTFQLLVENKMLVIRQEYMIVMFVKFWRISTHIYLTTRGLLFSVSEHPCQDECEQYMYLTVFTEFTSI